MKILNEKWNQCWNFFRDFGKFHSTDSKQIERIYEVYNYNSRWRSFCFEKEWQEFKRANLSQLRSTHGIWLEWWQHTQIIIPESVPKIHFKTEDSHHVTKFPKSRILPWTVNESFKPRSVTEEHLSGLQQNCYDG